MKPFRAAADLERLVRDHLATLRDTYIGCECFNTELRRKGLILDFGVVNNNVCLKVQWERLNPGSLRGQYLLEDHPSCLKWWDWAYIKIIDEK